MVDFIRAWINLRSYNASNLMVNNGLMIKGSRIGSVTL